jgi:hypothetical protein
MDGPLETEIRVSFLYQLKVPILLLLTVKIKESLVHNKVVVLALKKVESAF